MKLRATMDVEVDLPEAKALERFGSTDPYVIAQKLQREFDTRDAEELEEGVTLIGLSVRPHYG